MRRGKNLRPKWRPRHFAINTGCRGHPPPRDGVDAQGGVEPSVGSTFNSSPNPGRDCAAHHLFAVAQIVARDCRIDEPRRLPPWRAPRRRTSGRRSHRASARPRDAARGPRSRKSRDGFPNTARDSYEVEAVANVERLGAGAFDPNVPQPHLDRRLAQVCRTLAARLDQRHAAR